MAVFPLFIDLKGKKCIVVGGGKVAARKTAVLAGFDAEILVVSPRFDQEILRLYEKGVITVCRREYRKGDLEGAFLVIAATNDPLVNKEIAKDAGEAGAFVNVADAPDLCSFIFPAVVKKDKLVIGVSTSGSCPALSRDIRKKIERIVDGIDTTELGKIAKQRKDAIESIADAGLRREIIDAIVSKLLKDVRN